MLGIILAAGRGTRLRPITDRFSKGMVPVCGQPFMAWIMADLLSCGVDSFVIVGRPGDTACQDYFAGDARFAGRVQFVEQVEPMGSGDALRRAVPYVTSDVVISACDNLVELASLKDYLATWQRRTGELGLLALMKQRRELLSRSGVVAWDGQRIQQIIEKPTANEAPSDIISLPLYCLDAAFVNEMNDLPLSIRGEFEIQVPIRRLMARDPGVYGFLFPRRYTLTAPADLIAIAAHLLTRLDARQYIAPTVDMGVGVTLQGTISIGDNVTIGDGTILENVVALDGAAIPAGARLRNEIVF